MNIIDISEEIWSNCKEVSFGDIEKWNDDTFTKKWFIDNDMKDVWDSKSQGWYWFICNISYPELKKIVKPDSLPLKGCNFSSVSEYNFNIFDIDKLCFCDLEDAVVLYNGHQKNVMSRIREHFNLSNDGTGALGIKHYPLSNRKWKVKIFTKESIKRLPFAIQEQVQKLIQDKTGRCSIESAWRARNGWPVLCKE